jgi:hypothetical protein
VSDVKEANVATEASRQRHLLRFYKLSPWFLLASLLATGSDAAAQGQNPYGAFALAAGLFVFAETGRWLPFLLDTFRTRSVLQISVQSLVDLAALLAGNRRPALRDEWRAHLAGESGHAPVTWRKIRQALGFVASGIRFRFADAADLAWRPADAVLRSRTLSNLFVGGPVIVVLATIVRHDGRFGLVADIQDPGELGVILYAVIRTGRWWRGVKPPEPKARRTKE